MTSGTDVSAAGEPTRATSQTRTRTQPEAIVDTAEIAPVGPSRPRRISSPYERLYEEPDRRQPAPVALQSVVWLLFVIFVIGIVGLAVEHFHPSWISFLRRTISQPTTQPRHHRHGSGSSSNITAPPSNVLTEQSSTAKGATYSVPTSASYTLVISVPNRCYILVESPPNSTNYVFARTISKSESPQSIPVSGTSSLELGAQTMSVTVDVSGRKVGEILDPRTGYIFKFVPTGH